MASHARLTEVNRPSRLIREHHVAGVLEQFPVALLARAQGVLGAAALAPLGRLPQLALDGGQQAAELILHHVVVGARPHQPDRAVLADLSRDDDERKVEPRGLHEVQRLEPAEAPEVTVRQDEVEAAPVEGRAHLGGRGNLHRLHGVAGRFQTARQIRPVGGGILHHEHADCRHAHSPRRSGSRTVTTVPSPGVESTARMPR